MSKIVAYACSTRPNALWSAAQFDNAAPKNRTECDIPLVALSDLEAERQRSNALKALCDEMAKDFQRIEALDYKRAAVNGAAYEAHVIAYCALDRYRKEKEVGNG